MALALSVADGDTVCCACLQLFWEAFPAEGGKSRTTYMFAYSGELPT